VSATPSSPPPALTRPPFPPPLARLHHVVGKRPGKVVGFLANRLMDAVCALPPSARDALAQLAATFDVDLAVTELLSEQVPNDIVLVSESGIRTAEDVARVKACGVNAVLIGEALMRGQAGAISTLMPRNGN